MSLIFTSYNWYVNLITNQKFIGKFMNGYLPFFINCQPFSHHTNRRQSMQILSLLLPISCLISSWGLPSPTTHRRRDLQPCTVLWARWDRLASRWTLPWTNLQLAGVDQEVGAPQQYESASRPIAAFSSNERRLRPVRCHRVSLNTGRSCSSFLARSFHYFSGR